jgi:hypothetical protein
VIKEVTNPTTMIVYGDYSYADPYNGSFSFGLVSSNSFLESFSPDISAIYDSDTNTTTLTTNTPLMNPDYIDYRCTVLGAG